MSNATWSNPPNVQAFLALYGIPDSALVEGILAKYGAGQKSFKNGDTTFLGTCVSQNLPPGNFGAWNTNWNAWVAEIVARGIIYTTGKDCFTCVCPGAGQPVGVNNTGAIVVGTVGAAGGSIGTEIGTKLAQGTSLAADIPVIGSIASIASGIISGILEHHDVAVQKEDTTICQAVAAFNPTVAQIDQAVAQGSITAAQGIQAMQNLVNQVNGILQPVSGAGDSQNPCNAGCVYQHVTAMHLQFARQFYMDLSPLAVPPAAPGAYTPQTASAGIVAAQVSAQNPATGSPALSTLVLAGTQGGTFSTVPVVPTNGTGSATAGIAGLSPMLLIGIAVVAVIAMIFVFHK